MPIDQKMTKTIDIPVSVLMELGKLYLARVEGIDPTSVMFYDMDAESEIGTSYYADYVARYKVPMVSPSIDPKEAKAAVERKIEIDL